MNLSVSRFVHLRDSQYVLISSLQTPHEFSLARFNCTCFSRSYGNKASSELVRMSSARLCTFPWASRRPQWRLTRSSILSMAPTNSGSFTRDGDKISLKLLRARPAVHGSHLLCNSRQLSKPWSPPADITTSKLSPSVRADNTMKSCRPFLQTSQLRVLAHQSQLLLL